MGVQSKNLLSLADKVNFCVSETGLTSSIEAEVCEEDTAGTASTPINTCFAEATRERGKKQVRPENLAR